jgi:signal transduction histidine kinase
MSLRRRDIAALVVIVATLLLGVAAYLAGPMPSGMHLGLQDGQIVVDSVDPGSPAALESVQPGMVVIYLDDVDVLALSADARSAMVAHPRLWTYVSTLWPEQLPAQLAARAQLAREVDAAASASPDVNGYMGPPTGYDVTFPNPGVFAFNQWQEAYRRNSLPAVELGIVVALGGAWWLGTGRAGASLSRLAVTLPVATAVPLVVLPLQLLTSPPAQVASLLLVPAGFAPLVADFADRLENPATARRVRLISAGLAVTSVLAGMAFLTGVDFTWSITYSAILAGAMVFVPGFLAARPIFWHEAEGSSGSALAPGRFVESTELVLAAATPAVALTVLVNRGWNPFLVVIVAWLLAILFLRRRFLVPIVVWVLAVPLARRFTLLLRAATNARLQRDVVVAATEAERARIAADIHDDALQDLTMLVRRLDAAGDTENAEAARTVATRLRAICGDLRLPILDDLGLGAALDWLTERFQALAGGPVYLEVLRDEPRLPANVELALFRIAQEALTNAVKHGAPPIVVRYRSGGSWAELDVDDAGPGLDPGAAEVAELAGHLGLMNMSQRADSIHAELRIGRRPGGGTRVGVVWEADRPVSSVAGVEVGGVSAGSAQAAALGQP